MEIGTVFTGSVCLMTAVCRWVCESQYV